MAIQYKYKALDQDGINLKGVMTAENSNQVVEYLSSQNLIPINIVPAKDKFSLFSLKFFIGTDYENLIMFTNNLATMYQAGIPLLRALSIIKIGPERSRFNYIIQQIRTKIQSGQSLSQAMEDYSDKFSEVYVNSIKAGEESGKLEEILIELAIMLEKEMEISRLIKTGLRYPIIVISFIALAFTVLMTYVIPKFIDFYSAFGAQLPLPTRIMITISNLFTEYWGILLAILLVIVIIFKKIIDNPKGKFQIDKKLLGLPILGKLVIKGNVARFSLMFRILFKSGLPIVQTLNILAGSVKNSVISKDINHLEELFRYGSESEIINTEFIFFPDLAKQMISIGLESGSLDKMLHQVGLHYSKEVQYTARQLTSILEPILTLVISIFVLILALAIFLPMWNLIKIFNAG
ncbi:MAG: type II secretion system F family protein [Candidatus Zixiibacteriota bacterium]